MQFNYRGAGIALKDFIKIALLEIAFYISIVYSRFTYINSGSDIMGNGNTVYIDTNDNLSQYKLNTEIYNLIKNIKKKYSRISVVCIGTDRSTGDSFGPLVGYLLSKYSIYKFDLYGTIHEPVHALNLEETIKKIDSENTLVIAVDASVGRTDYIGRIGIGYGPICPGSGVGKRLPEIGDISICGIVAMSGFMPIAMLQNARLGTVYNMAEKTVHAITYVLYKLQLENKRKSAKYA